jgi:two-component sensor histidine kinase/ligand-binding sensor domain-containing protein
MYNKIKRNAGLLLLLLSLCLNAQAQLYQVEQYTEQNGLSDNWVWDMAQDKDGRMWFVTKRGVSIYDGIKWTRLTEKDSAYNGNPTKITKDPFENICIAYSQRNLGVSQLKDGKWSLSNIEGAVTSSWLVDFIADTLNGQKVFLISELWAKIYLYYNNGWKTIDFNRLVQSRIIYSVVKKDEKFLIAADNGLFYLSPEGEITKTQIDAKSKIIGLFYDEKIKRLYIAGETWFGYSENNHVVTLTDGISGYFEGNSPYFEITPDNDKGFIIGNWYSIVYYSLIDKSVKLLGIKNGLISDSKHSTLVDRENNLWFSCSRGVSKIYGKRFQNYNNVFFYYEREVSALLEYEPGKILFGGNYGFSFYQEDPVTRIPLFDSLEEPKGFTRVLDMCLDNEKNIWAATNGKGLRKIDKNKNEENYSKKLNLQDLVTSVIFDGEKLWIGTDRAIYYYIRGNLHKLQNYKKEEYNARKLFLSSDKHTVYASIIDSGLVAIRGESVSRIKSRGLTASNSIYALLETGDGATYVGTTAGLYKINGDSLVKADLNGSTVTKPVYLIIKDKKNNLWLGTNEGVYKFNGNTLRFFGEKDGLAGSEVNRSAGVVDANGRVWIGTNHGASCYFEEYDDTLNAKPPEIKITEISAGGKKYSPTDEPVLSNNANDIKFKLFGVSLINEKENKLYYKLEGFHKDWMVKKYTETDELEFFNLSPGDYRLLVQLSNSRGLKGPVFASSVFTISGPYYQSWWFYVLILIALGFGGFSIQRYFSQRRYNDYLKKEVDKVTKELTEAEKKHRETLLQEVHHRVKNNLQIVSSLLSLQAQAIGDNETSKLIRESEGRIRAMALIHEKLYRTKQLTTIDVSAYIEEVINHLRRSYLLNTTLINIRYSIRDINISSDSATTIGLIVNELVTNSFKHAFPENTEGTILISLNRTGAGYLHLKISDNGTGLKEPYEKESVNTLGLKVVEILAKQYKGTFSIYNNNGTTAEVTIKEQY